MPIKALLLPADNEYGSGLNVIRKLESQMIDISAFEEGISDATCSSTKGFIIKDNKVYMILKTYFDLDKKCRIIMAQEDPEYYDIIQKDKNDNTKSK